MVQGKSKAINFKRCPAPNDKWITVNHAHDAIVSPELFQAVQAIRQKADQMPLERSAASYSANIFKGKIFCAHCGSPLERKKNHGKYIFRCIIKHTAPGLCSGNRISEEAVIQALSEQLIQYREALADILNRPSMEDARMAELRPLEMELSHLQSVTKSLYENMVLGILSKQEYLELRDTYNERRDALNRQAAALKQVMEDEKANIAWTQESLQTLDEFSDRATATQKLVGRFVEKIAVDKEQKIHFCLSWKFPD